MVIGPGADAPCGSEVGRGGNSRSVLAVEPDSSCGLGVSRPEDSLRLLTTFQDEPLPLSFQKVLKVKSGVTKPRRKWSSDRNQQTTATGWNRNGQRSSDQKLQSKMRSLDNKLKQFLAASRSCLDEIGGLDGSETNDAVMNIVKAMVSRSTSHLQDIMRAHMELQSRKSKAELCAVVLEARARENQREAEKLKVEVATAAEKSRLEAEKMTLEADKKRIEAVAIEDKRRLEADKESWVAEKTRLEAEVRAAKEAEVQAAKDALKAESEVLCQICMVNPRDVVLLPCFHGQYCSQCIDKYRQTNITCPSCRAVVKGTVPCIT